MTRLGFLLDSESCIGCHACTVACKSEHDIPLGVNRTWVKYIERGDFPDTSRNFSVMRCNHCDDAPCIKICPTNALFRADNGVVDFDDGNCIGCKSCMNACPYDAIYINPDTQTAHKCNFCNHRVEVGLEPSCVIVCPTQAIKVVDLDDPDDPNTALIAASKLPVRTPEQKTLPKVHYRGADPAALDPTLSAIARDGMIWADRTADHVSVPPDDEGVVARTTYTTAHHHTWDRMVSGYMVTKAIAAGVMMIAALLVVLGHADSQAAVGVMAPLVAGVFLAATGAMLVGDLKQPGRFHFLLTRPNTDSWLVRGAWILGAFAAICAAWFLAGAFDAGSVVAMLALPAALLGAATAGYTAFLFAQCEGRDLWQTPWLLPALLLRAAIAGASAFAVADLVLDVPSPRAVWWTMLAALVGLAVVTIIEVRSHPSRHVELAVEAMTSGEHARWFWTGAVAGIAVPTVVVAVALVADTGAALPAAAGALALAGMFCSETAFVRAGQSVPLS
ncbi:MAG: 4Fe-4S dicluster domain-containing protein [Ilumatobacteraceae bacterium]